MPDKILEGVATMRTIEILGSPGYPMTGGSRVRALGAFQLKWDGFKGSTPLTACVVTARHMNVDISIGFSPSVEERSP